MAVVLARLDERVEVAIGLVVVAEAAGLLDVASRHGARGGVHVAAVLVHRAGVVPGHRIGRRTADGLADRLERLVGLARGCARTPTAHVFATAYSVSRLVATPAATSVQASGLPSSCAAWSSPTLPMKPENGGMPARFIAGTKKSTASTGAMRASPPMRISDGAAGPALDEAEDEEERRLDGDVVHDVEDRAGRCRLRLSSAMPRIR